MSWLSRTTWGLGAAIYFVVATLSHLTFSLWLVAERTGVWQGKAISYTYRDFIPYLLPLVAAAWAAWLVRSARAHGCRSRVTKVSIYWLLWVVCAVATDRWLTFSVAEYFHYPQYALLAILLARAIDPHHSSWPIARLLMLTTLLGALDELIQYLWITVSYSQYYDFNDVLVNALAAALGLMLYYGFRTPAAASKRVGSGTWCAGTASLALVLGLFIGYQHVRLTPPNPVPPGGLMKSDGQTTLYLQRQPTLYDRWHPAARRARHWVLGPQTGLCLTALVWLAWGSFGHLGRAAPEWGRRSRSNPNPPEQVGQREHHPQG